MQDHPWQSLYAQYYGVILTLNFKVLHIIATCLNVYTAPSPLETTFSFRMSGDSVDVCVETKEAKAFKLILRDTNNKRYVRKGEECCTIDW